MYHDHGVNRFSFANKSIPSMEVRMHGILKSPLSTSILSAVIFGAVFCVASLHAQTAAPNSAFPPPVTFTTEQDHQNMMDQLGIKALRPGPSGDEKAPN